MVKQVEDDAPDGEGTEPVSQVRRTKRTPRARVNATDEDQEINLIMADVAMRAGTTVLLSAVEKGFLRGRYGAGTASDGTANRSIKKTLTGFALAKLATRSLPGAVLVSGGLLAKTLFDRGRERRARLKSDRAPVDQTPDE